MHAQSWAELSSIGRTVGPHDLQIAATGLALGYAIATLNTREFLSVPGLQVVDATEFSRV